MLVRIAVEGKKVAGAALEFMRHNEKNETFFCALKDEAEALAELTEGSAAYGTKLASNGNQVEVMLSC
jgi:hypothetical protein